MHVRSLLLGLAAILYSGVAAAVPPGAVVQSAPYAYQPLGYQQMTSLATATALPSVPSTAIYAIMICSGQPINWRDDGVAPTSTVGMPLAVGAQIIFSENPLASVLIIQTAPSATCNVSYYR